MMGTTEKEVKMPGNFSYSRLVSIMDEVQKLDTDSIRIFNRMVVQELNNRRKYEEHKAGVEARSTLKIGDRVFFTDEVRPKYLAGATAIIKELRGTRAAVLVDQDFTVRRYGGTTTTVPYGLIEKIEEGRST